MANDYMHDGILHCGVCGKAKEVKFNLMGVDKTVPCLCDCEVAEREKEKQEWEEMQREIRISDLRVNSIKDRERRKCRFENAEMTPNLKKCLRYVENWDEMKEKNDGLILWGKCGNGKSFAAACIANALIDKGVPALMTSFPAILSDQNNTIDIARQMQEYDLVILDDLGAERQSQYALEKVFYIVDERYKSGKPLIVTTNQSMQTMLNYRKGLDKEGYAMGDNMEYARIYDRILEMCGSIHFEDDPRRKSRMMEKAMELKEILNG